MIAGRLGIIAAGASREVEPTWPEDQDLVRIGSQLKVLLEVGSLAQVRGFATGEVARLNADHGWMGVATGGAGKLHNRRKPGGLFGTTAETYLTRKREIIFC